MDDAQVTLLERLLREVFVDDRAAAAEDAGLDLDRLLPLLRKDAGSILAGAGSARSELARARATADDRSGRRPPPRDLEELYDYFAERLSAFPVARLVEFSLIAAFLGSLASWLFSKSIFIALGVALGAAVSLTVATRLAVASNRRVRLIARRHLRLAEQTYRTELRQAGVLPWLREQINDAEAEDLRTRLSLRDVSGLAEVDDPRHEVPTKARDRLRRLMSRMPGGAIGISGPRGVGKSTLMGTICTDKGAGTDEGEVLSVFVDAPVNYDARDFVLHLFARVCAAVLGPEDVARLRAPRRAGPLMPARAGDFSVTAVSALALMMLGAVLALPELLGHPAEKAVRIVVGVAVFTAGYALILPRYVRRLPRRRLSPDAWDSPDRLTAAFHLRRIWFQQTFSSGWSGALKLPLGEGSRSGSIELSEQRQSFPEIVADFRRFLVQVSAERQVRVGIDELDKMADAEAAAFLNGIKMIFRVPGCFFFVSVSEDAMSAFERRGLPFRDAFDSSFDDVFRMEPLGFDGSRRLLDRRILGMPQVFSALLHCMSGGLPRDLIRAARELTDHAGEEPSIGDAAVLLADASLTDKLAATRVAASRLGSEDGLTLLSDWLEGLRQAGAEPSALLGHCEAFDAFLLDLYEIEFDPDLLDERREVRRLATQLLTYAYFAATVVEFFSGLDEPDQITEAITPPTTAEPSSVDELARACRSFAAGLATTWMFVSAFRERHSLGTVASPRYPPPAGAASAADRLGMSGP